VVPPGRRTGCREGFGGNEVDHLDGTVDQVHVFDQALGSEEVKAVYDSGR